MGGLHEISKAMNNTGWIKIYRSLLYWEWADVPEMVALWVRLIIRATHEVTQWHGITAYQRFVIAFRQVHEGYVTFDMMPDGVQEMFLRQRLEETQRRLDVVNARLHPKKKGEKK